MPKTTRKYLSKKKTTTKEGYNEYKKLQMREYRACKKADQENKQKDLERLQRELKIKKVELAEEKRKIIDTDSEVWTTTIHYGGYSSSEKKDEQSKKSK